MPAMMFLTPSMIFLKLRLTVWEYRNVLRSFNVISFIDFSQNGFNQKLIAAEPIAVDFWWSLVLVTQYKIK